MTAAPERPWWRGRRVLALLLAALPIALLSAYMTRDALRLQAAVEEAQLRGSARALEDAVDAKLGAVLLMGRSLALSNLLDRVEDAPAFEDRMRRLSEFFDGWAVVLGPPPDHPIQAMSARAQALTMPPVLVPETTRALAPQLAAVFERGEAAVSDLFLGGMVRRPVITAMLPVDRDGMPRRALALTLEPAFIQQIAAGQEVPRGGFVAVADSAGRIVAGTGLPGDQQAWTQVPGWILAAAAGQRSGLVRGPGAGGFGQVVAFERPGRAPGWTVLVAHPTRGQTLAARRAIGWLALGLVPVGIALLILSGIERSAALRAREQETAALRRGRAEVERLHGALPCVIFLRDVAPDGSSRLLYRGGDLARVTGWRPEVYSARTAEEVASQRQGPTLAEHLRAVLAHGSDSITWNLRQPDGSWRTLRTFSRLLGLRPDGGGEVVGYTLDVSAERAAEARALAAARLASLGEMAGGLAHELKQPLQAISLAAENASEEMGAAGPVSVTRRLERISTQALRAGGIVENLRRFARGSDGTRPPAEIGVDAVIDAVMGLVGPALRDARIAVRVDAGDPPARLRADEIALEQVLANLLRNARDAIEARGREAAAARREIRIEARRAGPGMVAIRVADTGGGIPAAVMERLFEPFVTTKDVEHGTGLGLSICHGLVRAMGGTIVAENGAEGAVFTITLPAGGPLRRAAAG